jgi:nucleotide-binding universal stress UspA family protein
MTLSAEIPLSGPVLLATDLSARCDRALDRAVLLARAWNTRLIALHVLEPHPHAVSASTPSWRRLSDEHREMARYRLLRDLEGARLNTDIRVESGDAAEHILAVAQEFGCRMIVAGTARGASLGKLLHGTTVRKLVRNIAAPILVVKGRPHGPYERVVVTTDFSPESRHALRAAAAMLPGVALTLFHAYDAPFGVRRHGGDVPADIKRDAELEAGRFLEQTGSLPASTPVRTLIEYGEPETLLSDYVFQQRCELAVVGTQRTKGIVGAMIGSVAERLLDTLPCDILLVRAPPPAT